MIQALDESPRACRQGLSATELLRGAEVKLYVLNRSETGREENENARGTTVG